MAPYEARFVTHGDRVFDTEHFEAETDTHAITHARCMFTCGIGKGYQLWNLDRHVHTELFHQAGPSRMFG